MPHILNKKNIKIPYKLKVKESISITGKMVDCNDRPICDGIVVAFLKRGDRFVLISRAYTNKHGIYKLTIPNRIYDKRNIVIRYCAGKHKKLSTKIKCNVCLKHSEDFIIYGKIKDSCFMPIEGAIVAAFLEEDDIESEICHVFTGEDGSYMLNIPSHFKGKFIKIRAVKTNRDVYYT